MELNSRSKGQIAQLKVELRANQLNYCVSKPCADLSYDLIIDDNKGKLSRVQIKYCNRISGQDEELLELMLSNKESGREYYTDDLIDLILVYIPKKDVILKYETDRFHKKERIYINLKNSESENYFEKFIW